MYISDKKNKTAFLLQRFSGGGAERITVMLACALRDSYGYDVEIWATRFDSDKRAEVEKAGIATASPRDTEGKVRHRDLRTTRAVARLVKERGVDTLVVAVSPLGHMNLLRQLVAPACNIIFHLHGQPFWELLPFSTPTPWTASRVWNYLRKDIKEHLFGTYTRRAIHIYNTTYESCDAYVVLCNSYRTDLERRLSLDHAASKIRAIYNPLDSRFLADCDIAKKREVLYVGRLTHADKRVDRLIRVWRKLAPQYPDWHLNIVGDGRDRKNLEKLAEGLPSVSFEGYRDPLPYYQRASVVAMTSTFEGWPGALVEAIGCRCLPIAFRCSDGVAEIMNHGRGVLVEPFDEKAYSDSLRAIMDSYPIATDSDTRRWLTQFSVEAAAGHWHKLITEIKSHNLCE